MIMLDLLKKFKDEVRLELDIYENKSYENMIEKIKITLEILNVFKEHSRQFDLEQCFYITNIKDMEDKYKPYIVTNLDYDTIGVEIDYSLLTLLRVDVSSYVNRLEKGDGKVTEQLVLKYFELREVLESIIKKLENKIKVVELDNSVVIKTYENICKMYGNKTDEVLKQVDKDKNKIEIDKRKQKQKEEIDFLIMNYKIGLIMIKDDVVDFFKRKVKLIKKAIRFIKKKITMVKILTMFKFSMLKRSENEYKKKDEGKQ